MKFERSYVRTVVKKAFCGAAVLLACIFAAPLPTHASNTSRVCATSLGRALAKGVSQALLCEYYGEHAGNGAPPKSFEYETCWSNAVAAYGTALYKAAASRVCQNDGIETIVGVFDPGVNNPACALCEAMVQVLFISDPHLPPVSATDIPAQVCQSCTP